MLSNNRKNLSKDLISIVVPIYNVENYLEKCIQSILKQSFNDFELILVNDGSTDGSEKICNYYKELDSRIIYIYKENGGLSSARNIGIKNSTGNYITFIDSDDYISEEYLEVLYNSLLTNDADISVGRHCRVDEYNNISYDISGTNQFTCDSTEALNCIFYQKYISVSACSKLYKKSLFNDILFPEGKLYEDINTIPYIFEKAKVVSYESNIIYYYRIRFASITNSSYSKKDLDILNNSIEIQNHFKSNSAVSKAVNSYLFSKSCNLLIRMMNGKSYDEEDIKLVWQNIRNLRVSEILNKDSRAMNRIAAIISLFGKNCIVQVHKLKSSRGSMNNE